MPKVLDVLRSLKVIALPAKTRKTTMQFAHSDALH
jgi:hypothetical protein